MTWLTVARFPAYEVNEVGDVRRVAAARGATAGRVLKPRVGRAGYPVVRLTMDSRSHTASVHRLVCEAFIGPAPSKVHEVNHKNRDRSDARADNLEWVTRGENIRHAHGTGEGVALPRGEAKPNHKLTWDDVAEIRASRDGIRALGRRFGVTHTTIARIRDGRKWQARSEIERVFA